MALMEMHGIIFLTIMHTAGHIYGERMALQVFQTIFKIYALLYLYGMAKMLFLKKDYLVLETAMATMAKM